MVSACVETLLKQCNVCRQQKDVAEFSNDKSRKDGKQPRCKQCYAAYSAANRTRRNETGRVWTANWRAENRSEINAKARRRNAENPGKSAEFSRKWRLAHPDYQAAYLKEYVEQNRSKVYAWNAARRARKLQAQPIWANEDLIREFYDAARCLTKAFGMPWHVDHIVPLNSPIVCGLHCEANLQLLPGQENLKKSNLYWPDMPR